MEAENPPTSIEQWYRRATALDRNWRESRREEERLRKKEVGGGTQKQERQSLPHQGSWQRSEEQFCTWNSIEFSCIISIQGSFF